MMRNLSRETDSLKAHYRSLSLEVTGGFLKGARFIRIRDVASFVSLRLRQG